MGRSFISGICCLNSRVGTTARRRGARPLIPVLVLGVLSLGACYAPLEGPGAGSLEIIIGTALSRSEDLYGTDNELSASEVSALQSSGFIFAAVVDTLLVARYRTQMEAVYDRLVVDAAYEAGIFPNLTRRDIYVELGLKLPPAEIARADFYGLAHIRAAATSRSQGSFNFDGLPADRQYLVVVETYEQDANGSWITNIDLDEVTVVAGRSRSVGLNLQPERAVLYSAFVRRYGVPVLRVYQAGGDWVRNSDDAEITPVGVVVEYLGFFRGRHRHQVLFFENGGSVDREAAFDPDPASPTGGRAAVRNGGVLVYRIEGNEFLLFEWPDTLTIEAEDLNRGVAWLGGSNRYDNTEFFESLEIGLENEGESQIAFFQIEGEELEDEPRYLGNLCFDLEQGFDPRESAIVCSPVGQ